MSRYDKMLEINKKASEQKIEQAKKAIFELMAEGERVTVPKLMEKTGLSRGFFYKNQIVRVELERVMSQQAGMSHPRKKFLIWLWIMRLQSCRNNFGYCSGKG